MLATRNTSEDKPEQKPFDMIYQAAKKKDPIGMAKALELACIHVYDGDQACPPLAKLAAENDEQSIDFLRVYDNSAGEFEVWQAYGYALGNHKEKVDKLLKKFQEKNSALTSSILLKLLFAFAQIGETDTVYDFLNLVHLTKHDLIELALKHIAAGLVLNKESPDEKESKISEFLEIVKEHHASDYAGVLVALAPGYLVNRDQDSADRILSLIKTSYGDHFDIAVQYITFILGSRGHYTEGCAFLQTLSPEQLPAAVYNLAAGLARGGYKVKTQQIWLMANNQISFASIFYYSLTGYAMGGHKAEAEKMYKMLVLSEKSIGEQNIFTMNYMAYGFALGKHKKQAYEILGIARTECPNELKSIVNSIATGEDEAGGCLDKAILLKTLTTIEDPIFRHSVADYLAITVKDYSTEAALSMAVKYNAFMKEKEISYNQLLGWINNETRTILLEDIFENLPRHLNYLIATYLTPISLKEVDDLSPKLEEMGKTLCPARFFRRGVVNGRISLTEQDNNKQDKDKLRFASHLN